MNKNSYAVLIPNFNGALFIKDTIFNIRNLFPNIEIIIVDDGSTDSSVDVLEKLEVTLIKRDSNGGFASAVNAGISYAINKYQNLIVSNSDVCLTLSNKIELENKFLNKLPELNYQVIGFLDNGLEVKNSSNISGFFFILNLRNINSIGYFDESFFMYGEEQEYFRRIVKKGYKIIISDISIKHLGEASSFGLKNSWLSIRNALMLEFKFGSLQNFFKTWLCLFLMINKIYKPINTKSYQRIVRPGMILGNLMLILATIKLLISRNT
jgi:GT2 family glycosyltransferase